ncbi:MAG: Ig-like domain-containing protein, partial [Planctomycetaceae bacterium]|nr:Ig-like domain-containing protein [Planctomycetaceae bacterium]
MKRILGKMVRVFAGGGSVDGVNQLRRYHKTLRLESLESRELLSGVSLLAEIGGYASTAGDTEIRFELQSNNNDASKLDITINSLQAGLDPSAIKLRSSNGTYINLTNVFNTTTQSGGSAVLAKGSYSILVKADVGAGNFNLKISFVESTSVPDLSAMTIITDAAVSQQKSGWDSRRDYFNAALYSVAPEYGTSAFNGGKVIDLFPEADVNKDGKLDNTDVQLANALINSGKTETKLQIVESNISVIYPDQIPPTISATLNTQPQNDTTTNPAISGKIIDPAGIKSAAYKINNLAEQQITLANDGSFTILNDNSISEGTYSVTIIATDNYGNTATYSIPEFTYEKQVSIPPQPEFVDNENGIVTLDPNFTIAKIDGKNVTANNQVTLNDNKGIITIANNNFTLSVGSQFDYLAQNESSFLEL